MLIVPAIDLMDGKVVRLQRGDFNRVMAYDLTPLEYAKKWQEEGASIIHVVDLDGAKCGEPKNFSVIVDIIKSVSVKVEVGGGIRTAETIKKYAGAGAARVVLSTKVLEDPSFLLSEPVRGCLDKIVVSIDIRHMESPELVTSGTGGWLKGADVLVDIPSFIQSVSSAGVKYVNFSDISKDGMMVGPDPAKILLFLKKARKAVSMKLFFTYAGGISSLDDIDVLNRLGEDGVDAVIVGRALYENKFSLKEAIALAKR
ncbi:MAG TPA: 1-(5-phosphoribosyl)-5-((5-phosphoribosylamino)methylideneamino)imidazole-4-carboxamide isomerase [Candidatus Omnitrophica bacterium]|nr:1-(5-phosphoribosyl)-5-((5-phosphoribosylamino)methylideneamino)imidazole-4-carboxamide isomerase [Candidatus Omnitrophota bacterium]